MVHQGFYSLTRRGQALRLRSVALAALRHYSRHKKAEVSLVAYREGTNSLYKGSNAIFKVRSLRGDQAQICVLRVHRPDNLSEGEVRSECQWLEKLSKASGIVAPEPLRNDDGRFTTTIVLEGVPERRTCTLLRWVQGRFCNNGAPSPGQLTKVGRALAQLHEHGSRFSKPRAFRRPRMDYDWFFGPKSQFRPSEKEKAKILGPKSMTFFRRVERHFRDAVNQLGEGSDVFGLIHGDFHMGNCVFRSDVACAIDFDDCGYGHYLYDIARVLTSFRRSTYSTEQKVAVLTGYRAVRELDDERLRFLNVFVAARSLLLCNWIIRHSYVPRLKSIRSAFIKHHSSLMKKALESVT